MQVWNALHAARCKYRTQKIAISAPSRNFVGPYLRNEGMYRQSEKNLLSSNTSSTCPHNMVNFDQRLRSVGEFGAPLQISTGFASRERYCTASSSGRQPNFAALNRGRHLCSAGRPSGWALAHILVSSFLYNHLQWQEEIANSSDIVFVSTSKMVWQITTLPCYFQKWFGSWRVIRACGAASGSHLRLIQCVSCNGSSWWNVHHGP